MTGFRISSLPVKMLVLSLFVSGARDSPAQWSWALPFGSGGNETPAGICNDQAGRPSIAGTIGDSLSLDGVLLAPQAEDALLLALDAEGHLRWHHLSGGVYDDGSQVLACADTLVYWGGYFWGQATLADTTLTAPAGSKGLFVHALDAHYGQRRWSICLHGTGQKELTALVPAHNRLWVVGFFSDTLFAGPDTLVATGTHDLFALLLDPGGSLLQVRQAGLEGSVQATAATLQAEGALVLGGRFKGKLAFGSDTLVSSTLDYDVFAARFDSAGQALWARKAGGVHEARAARILTDAAGNVHLLGTFLGVLDMNDTLGILTPGFHTDGFWLTWSATGQPLAARRIGGPANDQLLDAGLRADTLWVSGSYAQTLALGELAIQATDDLIDGFVAAFGLSDSQPRQLWSIGGQGIVQVNRLALTTEGLWLLGRFNEEVQLGQSWTTAGLYDLFVAARPYTTPVAAGEASEVLPHFWPNPARTAVFFEAPSGKWRLLATDMLGKKWYDGPLPHRLDTASWPRGTYALLLHTPDGRQRSSALLILH